MKVAVLGLGREGRSVLKYLKKSPDWHGAKIETLDKKLGKSYLKNLERFDVIFRSPGVHYNLPELAKARRRGVEFLSATKLFFEKCKAKIIGVTGTKGKGTTSTLLYNILKSAGKKVFLAGNIGKSALDILPRARKNSIVILELSSFQLQDLGRSPDIAVVLDVFPDHQDAHLNLKEYYEAKTNIAKWQKKDDKIFFFLGNPITKQIAQKSHGKRIPVNKRKFVMFGPEDLKIPGIHNFRNAVMAATVAKNLGVPEKKIIEEAKNFRGLEHRLEFAKKIGDVEFYNDSASTNPGTVAAAVSALGNKPLILIAGGQDKNLDYLPLARAIKKSSVKLVVLMGENKDKIARSIRKSGIPISKSGNLRAATNKAYNTAKKYGASIIFSPGAASFDMFKNYADRGEKFKKIVRRLQK